MADKIGRTRAWGALLAGTSASLLLLAWLERSSDSDVANSGSSDLANSSSSGGGGDGGSGALCVLGLRETLGVPMAERVVWARAPPHAPPRRRPPSCASRRGRRGRRRRGCTIRPVYYH